MIKEYLKWLQNEETEIESVGGFAIDSFPTKANKRPLPVIYPESYDPDNVYDIKTKRIMIDLDGTIHKYSKGFSDGSMYDEPFEGCKEIINLFKKDGFKVLIFTARLSSSTHSDEELESQLKLIEQWLNKYEIEVDGITAEKLPAEIYIDDKGFKFEGIWNKKMYENIKNIIG